MKPLDQFKRTPPRRYDKAPPPPPGDKRTFEPAIRKRYFDMPTFDHRHIDRWLGGAVCAVLLLTLCNASAPMGDVPSVQERFSQWAVIQNEKTVQQLPGATPEPDSALAAAASFNPDQEKQEVKQEAKQETILAQEETRQETAQTQTTADTSTGFKHYEPGQLHYESDGITVSIEQKTKDGMTYFVCGIMETCCGMVRGLGRSWMPMVVTIFGACVMRIVWIYTIFAWKHTLPALYVSYPISWVITAAMHVVCFVYFWKRIRRKLEQTAPAAADIRKES